MRYDFDTVIERRNTYSSKWDNIRSLFGSDDVLPMWVADSGLPDPQPSLTRSQNALSTPFSAIQGQARRPSVRLWNGWRGSTGGRQILGQCYLTPGVVPAVNAAVRTYAGEGGAVVVKPCIPSFLGDRSNNKVRTVSNLLLKKGDRYEVDFEDLEKGFRESGAKAFILCSPHNPVGRVWTRDELKRMGDIALKAGATVISDEIHCELVFKGQKHIPFASVSPEFEASSITCFAPSKTFNIAGMHCSVAIIPDADLRKRFNDARAGIMGSPDFLAIAAMEAAFRYGDEWLEQVMDYVEANLNYLLRYFEERIPRIKPVKPEGTYLVWLDCRGLGIDDPKELHKFFNEKAKVGMNAGYTFGPGGEGFMRMNIGCPRSLLDEGLRRIEAAVNAL